MDLSPPTSPVEEDPPFLTVSEELLPSQPIASSTTVPLSLSNLLNPPLLLQTDVSECGGQLWPAGKVLSEYLIRHHLDDLRGKTILELGTGSGLVGLAIALALHQKPLPPQPEPTPPTTTIYLTDGQPSLLPLIAHNIALNNLSPSSPTSTLTLRPLLLPWGTTPLPLPLPPDPRSPNPETPDIILAADCVYFEPAFPLLEQTILEAMGDDTVLWFCYLRRRRRDGEMMKRLGRPGAGLVVREVGVGELGRRFGRGKGVVLFELRRRRRREKGAG